MKNFLALIVLCLYTASPLQATIVIGDSSAATNNHTFSFHMGFGKYTQTNQRFWMASGEDINGLDQSIKQFGLSYVQQELSVLTTNPTTGLPALPIARPLSNEGGALIYYYDPVKETVYTTGEPNPISGAQFALFDIAAQKPVFVVGDPTTLISTKLYYAYDIQHYEIQTEDQFNKTDLLLHDFGTDQYIKALVGNSHDIYTATSDAGNWGAVNSTITKLTPSVMSVKQEQTDQYVTLPYLKELASEEITVSTPALIAGGADLASINPSVTLSSPTTTAKTYVGLDITTNATGQGTAISLIKTITAGDTSTLTFNALASDSVLANDTVISAKNGNRIRVSNIATMTTSTSLDYLIVSHDNGVGGAQNIYALPILPESNPLYGTIANVNSIQTSFQNNSTRLFSTRVFTSTISDAEQINPTNATYSAQLLVGTATPPLSTGTLVKDMYVLGDSVYIIINESYASGGQPGTWYSQALFAADGHIVGWSPWARDMGSDGQQFASGKSYSTTSAFYGYLTGTYTDIYQTQWVTNNNLTAFFNQAKTALGGVQGIFNFGQMTPGFNNEISLITTTGFNQVTIGQTGYTDAGSFKAKVMTDTDVVTYNNIADSGALVAAECAHNTGTDDHWLFVAGATGLYVLTDDTTGVTWNGNLASVAGLDAGQTWKTVGNFSFVKKLIWDKDSANLYVLTRDSLYQIALDANKFKENPSTDLNAITILDKNNFAKNDKLLDAIIEDGFCVLGTTDGLYSFNIPPSSSTLKPTYVPTGLSTNTQLFIVSSENEAQRSFKTLSNLYVLNNTFGVQQARLNRFIIQDETVTPFQDTLVAESSTTITPILSSFINFSQYITNYFTDGSWNLASNYFLGTTQPSTVTSPRMLQLFTGIKTGQSSTHIILPVLSSVVPLTNTYFANENMVLGIMRESTSGALITSGSFGGLVNA